MAAIFNVAIPPPEQPNSLLRSLGKSACDWASLATLALVADTIFPSILSLSKKT